MWAWNSELGVIVTVWKVMWCLVKYCILSNIHSTQCVICTICYYNPNAIHYYNSDNRNILFLTIMLEQLQFLCFSACVYWSGFLIPKILYIFYCSFGCSHKLNERIGIWRISMLALAVAWVWKAYESSWAHSNYACIILFAHLQSIGIGKILSWTTSKKT